VAVAVDVTVAEAVAMGVSVGFAVGPSVGPSVAVLVAVLVAVAVGLLVAVAVCSPGSVGVAVPDCCVAVGVAVEELESSSLPQAANVANDRANRAVTRRWQIWLESMGITPPKRNESPVQHPPKADRAVRRVVRKMIESPHAKMAERVLSIRVCPVWVLRSGTAVVWVGAGVML
jgi:hypothetical protein